MSPQTSPIEILTLLVLGVGIGTFGTMIGAGGGFLTVPILILGYNFEPRLAVGTGLVLVLFNAASGTLAYLKQKRVDIQVGALFTALSIPGAILGAFLTSYLESRLFKLIFAGMLAASSVYLAVRPSGEASNLKIGGYRRNLTDFAGQNYEYSVNLIQGCLISLGNGFVASIFGIGGGIIHVPAMIFLLGMPVHVSTATSHFILAFTALFGSATHAQLGNVNFEFAIPLGTGAVAGAQLGALASRRTRGRWIQRLLGLALIVVAVRLILQAT